MTHPSASLPQDESLGYGLDPDIWLRSHSLAGHPRGGDVARVLSASLQAVDPGKAVRRHVQRHENLLHICGRAYDLSDFRRVLLVGAGKAGAPMAQAMGDILGEALTEGIIIVKEGYSRPERFSETFRVLKLVEAGHPIPDQRGAQGARQMAELLADAYENDLVICLISGGGSALLVSPVEGINLAELQALTNSLLACGADIYEINTLRKHLELLKGGGLARLAAPAKVISLILSDVIGDPLDVIASGPTVPDPTTFGDAWRILERYHLLEQTPPAILRRLERGLQGLIAETPKPGETIFARTTNWMIGSNLLAAQAAMEQARALGLNTLLLTTCLQGEARQAGRFLAALARQIAASGQPVSRPACLVAGGETTVTLHGDGLGGRNQELALGAVADLVGLQDILLVSLATDGGDGPTDAAGAAVSGETYQRACQAGLQVEDFLKRNDAYHFFAALGDLLKPGPTMTNVNDLTFIFAF